MSVSDSVEHILLSQLTNYLKPRPRDMNKGGAGHVLVIGGGVGHSGAALLAAMAAYRVGSGLVSVATHTAHAAVLNLPCPEIMCYGIRFTAQLQALLVKASVVVLGPGLGQSVWARRLWRKVLATSLPLIVDADGLNLLAKNPVTRSNWILTPHPGEAARLLDSTTEFIQADRVMALKAMQERYQGVIVLKGAGTLVLTSTGVPSLCSAGNPGMATGGMGDILSGVIAGLVAQGVPLEDAAKLGVYLHARAGDLVAASKGERGMLASDLLPYLQLLVNGKNE
jgi:hydroxyethylthiazole kinase-like uncharacterized protein yjeF